MISSYIYSDHLETERLYTRFLTPGDAVVWADFFKDKDAITYLSMHGFTKPEDQAANWLSRQLQRYQQQRYGLQALIHKQTGEMMGQCGLLLQKVDDISETEVGYHMFKKHWGQGYAPEAARRFIRFAFENNLSESVISIIHINNRNSQRVAEKNGLKREKQTRWNDLDVWVYRMDKARWL